MEQEVNGWPSRPVLYRFFTAMSVPKGKLPPGWMRIASHSVAVDVQLATNSTGLRLVRGFETSFKHLNHQSHVQWEKNTNYSVLQHHHLTSSNFSKIMPYSIHHPCRNFSSSAKSLRLGVTWASRRRWLSHRPDCSSKHWARRPRPCWEQGCFLRTEVTQPEWNMVTWPYVAGIQANAGGYRTCGKPTSCWCWKLGTRPWFPHCHRSIDDPRLIGFP